mgnify:FL=1
MCIIISVIKEVNLRVKLSLLNLFAFLISAGAFAALLYLSRKSRLLKKSILLISIGIFIAMTFHSLTEYFESIGYLNQNMLFIIMPIFISIGSIILVLGIKKILNDVVNPLRKIIIIINKKQIRKEDIGEFGDLLKMDNELGEMFSALFDSTTKLEIAKEELQNNVNEKTEELRKKNKELEETLEEFYTVRVGTQRDLESGKIKEENKKIREKLDRLKND